MGVGRVVLIGGKRLILGKLGEDSFRSILVGGVHHRLRSLNRFGFAGDRSAIVIRTPSRSASLSSTTRELRGIFNVTTLSETTIYRGGVRDVVGATHRCLRSRLLLTGAFGIRTGEDSGGFPLGSPRVYHRLNKTLLGDFGRLGISIRGPSIIMAIRIHSGRTFIHKGGVGNTNNVPANADNHNTVLVDNNVSSPITTCVVTGEKVRLITVRFTSPPCADRLTRVGILSLLHEITTCDNAVAAFIIPFARVRRTVESFYPRRCFALIVHHVVVGVDYSVTGRRGYLTLVANRDLNRITDRAVRTLNYASTISSLPIFHPYVNVSGSRVVTVSEGVSAFSASVRPCRSYYAIFAPGRPHAHPGPRSIRSTRTGVSKLRRVVGETRINTHGLFVGWFTPL